MKIAGAFILIIGFCLTLRGQEVTLVQPLPDSCFDAIVFTIPEAQTSLAKERFTAQLDFLLRLPNPDPIALAIVYRRLSVVHYIQAKGIQNHEYALKSIGLLEKLADCPPLEIAKSRLVYAYALSTIGRYDTLALMMKSALNFNRRSFGEISAIQEQSYRVLGMCYNNIGQFSQALNYANQAIAIGRRVYSTYDLQLVKSLYLRGVVLLCYDDFPASLSDLYEAEKILNSTVKKTNPAFSSIYQFLGLNYRYLADYERALDYYKRGLSIVEQTLGPSHDRYLYICITIGELYLELLDFPAATFYLEKAWDGYTANNTLVAGPDKACRMVQLYTTVGDYEKEMQAFKYYIEKTIGFGKLGKSHGFTVTCYQTHASALLRQKKANEALIWIDKAIEINQLINPNDIRINHDLMLQKASAFIQLQQFEEASSIIHNVLNTSPILSKKRPAFSELASIHLNKFQLHHHEQDLQQAWSYHLQAMQVFDSLRYSYQSPNSRIQQAELSFYLFESALNTSYERQDLPSSLWVAEKSKATALLDNQRDDLARRIAGLPDSLLHRESGLKSQIAELEKTVYEKPAGVEKKAAEAALFEKKQSLNILLQRFEKNYPLYFQLKYNTSLASATQLQANLPPATAMLEYFVGDSSIFVFSITARDLQLRRIAKPKDFEANIQALRQALTNAELRFLKKDFYIFTLAASKLYDYLLATPLATLPPSIQHLIIVPDGSLNYVPFEVLGKNNTAADFKSYPYLLKNYSISYATSANLWLEQSKTAVNRNTTNSALDLFAGFAPSYNSSDTLSSINSRTRSLLVRAEDYEIPGAALEVQEIAKLLNGKTWLGDAATKTQFKQQSPHFQVLHLAMHSIMDDANPLFSKLLFTQLKNTVDDNDLYANDLYNLRLPAQMVVLSACNTGNGQLRRGEGVMSLSRAFTFTGVPSTVMSLWKAPDEATRKLMLAFYQNLKLGLPKDEALQKAKLSQLLGAEPGLSNPFFWAGFVANGDMRALF